MSDYEDEDVGRRSADEDETLVDNEAAIVTHAAKTWTAPAAENPDPSVPIALTDCWLSMKTDTAGVAEAIIMNNVEVLSVQNTQTMGQNTETAAAVKHIISQNKHIISQNKQALGLLRQQSKDLRDIKRLLVTLTGGKHRTADTMEVDDEDEDEQDGEDDDLESQEQLQIQQEIQTMPHESVMGDKYNAFVKERGSRRRIYSTITPRAKSDAREFRTRLLVELALPEEEGGMGPDDGLVALLKRVDVATFQRIYQQLGQCHPESSGNKKKAKAQTGSDSQNTILENADGAAMDTGGDGAVPDVADSNEAPVAASRKRKRQAKK